MAEDNKTVKTPAKKVATKSTVKKAPAKAVATKKPTTKKTTSVKTAGLKKASAKAVATKKPIAQKTTPKTPKKKTTTKKNTLSVTLIKSFYGRLPAHRATITGLGLKRINHSVELADTPEIRGMINKVAYLLKVED